MSGPDKKNLEINVYPQWKASERFIELADIILNNDDMVPKNTPRPSVPTARWSVEKDKEEYRYELSKKYAPDNTGHFALTLQESKKINHYGYVSLTRRYTIEHKGSAGSIHRVSTAEPKADQSDKEKEREVASEALGILTRQIPRTAYNVLQRRFDADFNTAAGSYILSSPEIADDSADWKLDLNDAAIDDAVSQFEAEVTGIEDNVVAYTKSLKDSLRVHAIWSAIDSKPETGFRDSTYMYIDLALAALVVAQEAEMYKDSDDEQE